jgi:hypothetical protein
MLKSHFVHIKLAQALWIHSVRIISNKQQRKKTSALKLRNWNKYDEMGMNEAYFDDISFRQPVNTTGKHLHQQKGENSLMQCFQRVLIKKTNFVLAEEALELAGLTLNETADKDEFEREEGNADEEDTRFEAEEYVDLEDDELDGVSNESIKSSSSSKLSFVDDRARENEDVTDELEVGFNMGTVEIGVEEEEAENEPKPDREREDDEDTLGFDGLLDARAKIRSSISKSNDELLDADELALELIFLFQKTFHSDELSNSRQINV